MKPWRASEDMWNQDGSRKYSATTNVLFTDNHSWVGPMPITGDTGDAGDTRLLRRLRKKWSCYNAT